MLFDKWPRTCSYQVKLAVKIGVKVSSFLLMLPGDSGRLLLLVMLLPQFVNKFSILHIACPELS